MSETSNSDVPRGSLRPVSRRVMNLAHLLTQNARRHGDRIGFIWGDRSWTWRQIDGAVSALAAEIFVPDDLHAGRDEADVEIVARASSRTCEM